LKKVFNNNRPVISVFVNDILEKLSKTNRGCFLKSVCYNSTMYADDLILLAISLQDLQFLVDWPMCQTYFTLVGMEFSAKKYACIREIMKNTS